MASQNDRKSRKRLRPAPPAMRTRARKELNFDALNGHLGYFLRDLQVRVFKDFIRTFARVKVRPAQYSTLVLIAANPGSSQAAIGEALQIERARFARLLHDLEIRGWTKRVPAPEDRRSHSLFLTGDGHKALARFKYLAAQHEQQLADFLGTRQRKVLIALLRKLKERAGTIVHPMP